MSTDWQASTGSPTRSTGAGTPRPVSVPWFGLAGGIGVGLAGGLFVQALCQTLDTVPYDCSSTGIDPYLGAVPHCPPMSSTWTLLLTVTILFSIPSTLVCVFGLALSDLPHKLPVLVACIAAGVGASLALGTVIPPHIGHDHAHTAAVRAHAVGSQVASVIRGAAVSGSAP